MKFGKKLVCALLILVMVASMVACTQTGAPPAEPTPPPASGGSTPDTLATPEGVDPSTIQVAMLYPSFTGYVYSAYSYGAIAKAEELGMPEPILLECGGYDHIDVQIKQVEDMVASGVDAIVLMPVSEDAMNPVIEEAIAAGVYVVEIGNRSSAEGVHSRFGYDEAQVGRIIAQTIVDDLGGQGNVAAFCGPTGTSWAIHQWEGAREVFDANPGIKILAEQWLIFDVGTALNTMNDMLQTFHDIDYVYAVGPAYANGAASAIETAGRLDEIKIACMTLDPVMLDLMQKGYLTTVVAHGPVERGGLVIQAISDLMNGIEVPAEVRSDLVTYHSVDVQKSTDPQKDFIREIYPADWKLPV